MSQALNAILSAFVRVANALGVIHMSAVPAQVLKVGEWSVDPALGEISSGGRVTKLDPLTMRLLLYFAANSGRVVALQELLDAVWPNVVVTPQSVYNTVAQLRRTLGDLAEAPTYIENIPRKGYRLIAKVDNRLIERRATGGTPAQTPSMPPAAANTPVALGDRLRSRLLKPRTLGVVAAIALLSALAIVLGLARAGFFSSRSASASTAAHAIAVMPFKDLTEAKDREYLAEGLAEEIGSVLSRLPTLRVIGRGSAFASRADSVADIASKLHVDHILEGSVQSSARGLRITAALIRTDGGQYLWSKTYDRATDDYFSVEDEIARDVAGALTNTGLPPNRSASACGQNGEAYNLLLQGRYLGRRNTRVDRDRSIDLYQQAVVLEPGCARAWAWLSTGYGVQTAEGWAEPESGYQHARDAAERALRLDPLEADAHAALAYVEEYRDWNWSGAQGELQRARALNAGDVRVLNMSGHLAMDMGQIETAIAFYRRAVAADPLSPGALGGLAGVLWGSGNTNEAEAIYRRRLMLSPAGNHTWLGLILLDRGDKAGALAEIEQETNPEQRLTGLGIVQSALGNRAASDQALAELIEKFPNRPTEIAGVYARRAEPDAAFQWLERAFIRRDSGMLWLKNNVALRPLYADPRYNALLRRMGLPPD
jgi:TolB-like protein/DNA-binding winged helix-turn-helix (wHTH) protein/Tfp pilus assembly protein PilF